jgi:hypothetical protein
LRALRWSGFWNQPMVPPMRRPPSVMWMTISLISRGALTDR